MSITVERRTTDAMTVVALRDTIPTHSDEHLLWARLMPEVARQGIGAIGPCGVIEHDDEFTERDVDEEVFLPVAPGTTAAAPLTVHVLPERECLVAHVVGPYDQISRAHDLIAARLAADGLRLRGDGTDDPVASRAFNLYLATPEEVGPEDLVTDVCVPIRP
ncbi:GyrI-like domain-containing protein [Acidipropionibacterium timonense]|uniref:GyrI-like domain-containing protein n=1 Tax=Acidipropionibacterium timonense TaxID=2161818 RepID=UPI00103195EF|nr:GyrI-like domain-containing protein [Acidipropionibacterium timonense]